MPRLYPRQNASVPSRVADEAPRNGGAVSFREMEVWEAARNVKMLSDWEWYARDSKALAGPSWYLDPEVRGKVYEYDKDWHMGRR